MVHGKNRIPYRIDRRLTGLAGPDYGAIISFGLPIEPEDSQYGESRLVCRGDNRLQLLGVIVERLYVRTQCWYSRVVRPFSGNLVREP